MTTHTPLRCAYSSAVAYGSGASGKILFLDSGNYPSYSNYGNLSYIWNGTNGAGDWTLLNSSNYSNPANTVDPLGPLGPSVNGVKLSGRINEAMGFDGTQVVLYGGQGSSSLAGVYQDTWGFNTTSNTWSLLAPSTKPYGRQGAKATYLPGTGMVMFGGALANGQLLNETWLWNSTSQNWSQFTTANVQGAAPEARVGHAMATNTTSGTVLLFGGRGTNQQFNSTWTFTAANGWTNLNISSANSPSVRSEHCMCYDSVNNLFVMFGGQNEYNFLHEVWTFNPVSSSWTQIPLPNVSGTSPSGRIGAMMAFDTVSGTSILTGGISAESQYPASSTWSFNASTNLWKKL